MVQFPYIIFRIPVGSARGKSGNPGVAKTEGAGKPAIIIDTPTPHDIEKLKVPCGGCLRVCKTIDHAHPINWILRETVYFHGRLNFYRIVNSGYDVNHMVKLRAWSIVVFNFCRP